MKILVLDNYDSFTYNLVHILRTLGHVPEIHRNDKISLERIGVYDKILLSPGPGIPDEAGIMKQVIATYAPTKSILGICLGHQGISEAFGARLLNMPEVLHGVAHRTQVTQPQEPLFADMPSEFMVCRYHSWTVVPESVPAELEVTSVDNKGNVMAIRHRQYDVRGVQFHPESILTEHGKKIMENWLLM
ncbi:MAG: aminodeoxychorismate/anthranilate synthase component II [Cytophagales bacterium]|nr:aminodeoxychorismate/anthranilate synthase component II [Cytophagales bacterium]